MKNVKQFIVALRHNKIFKRVLSVILSLTMLIGVVQLIAVALPEPETQADLDVSFAVTTHTETTGYYYNLGFSYSETTLSFNKGSINDHGDGSATAVPNGSCFAYWTVGDGEEAEIYSYSATIRPSVSGTYVAWFADEIKYVGDQYGLPYAGLRFGSKSSDYNVVSIYNGTHAAGTPDPVKFVGAGCAAYSYCYASAGAEATIKTAIVLDPILLETAIQGTDYEIVNFPVTLFDYDMAAFNAANPFTNGNYETLHFWNGNKAENYGEGFTNYGDSYPKGGDDAVQAAAQGIWESELDENGLPVPNALLGGNNTNLFEPVNSAGKTVYGDVGFQFVKDSSGWYTYDSALNHAQYDSASNEVKLYYESLGIGSTGDKVAGFLPFNTFSEAYYSGGSAYPQSFSDWENKLTSSSRQTGVYALDNVNYHNGMVMEYSFYLPENGTVDGTPGGEPIQFEFNGDDDMWVFVDGELVLDIGGGHGAVAGMIDFQNGTTWVERAVKNQSETPAEANETFVCEEDQYHEIKIFYLERFAGESNCRIRFNLPAVPQKSINVEKQVAAETEGVTLPQSVNDDEFTFALFIQSYGGTYDPAANAEYSVVKTSNPTVVTETGVTDENGCFKINAGERAIFEGYDSTDMFVVTEILSDSLSKKYSLVYIDDILATMQQYSSMPKQVTNKGNRVVFTNILTDPLVDAQLTKTAEAAENNQFKITLSVANAAAETPITVTDTVSRYFDIVSAQDSNSEGTVSGQTVTFNTVTAADGSWTGEIIIAPKAEFWGGNAVPTNDGASATSAAEIEHPFSDSPTVDVPLNLPTLTGNNRTIYLGETAPTFNELFTGQSSFVVPTDESNPDYWKTAFVTVSDVTYSPSQVDPAKSGTYTASVTVTPKNEGTVQSATVTENAALTVKTCTLTITKNGGADSGNYIFRLLGSGNDLAAAVNTVVSVGNNGTVTVKGLPIGTYTVTEDSGWSWRFNADDETAELSPASDTASVTVVNEKVNGSWLDAEDAVTNDFRN